ncbi:MAG: SH3 domain-containing protein [Bacteroidia bacterium]
MKSLVIFFLSLLLLMPFLGFAQDEWVFAEDNIDSRPLPMDVFKAGDTVQLFGENVRLRQAPNTNSETLTMLAITDSVKVLKRTDSLLAYEGRNFYWYQVKWQDKTGYISDAFFARVVLKNRFGKDFYFRHHFDDKLGSEVSIRVQKGNKMVDKITLSPSGSNIEVHVMDDQGLKNLDNIIVLDYSSEACGENGGLSYIFLNNEKLYHVADLSSIGDGGVLHEDESFTFPIKRHNNSSDRIIYNQEHGKEKADGDYYWYQTVQNRKELTWTGKELLPKNYKTIE